MKKRYGIVLPEETYRDFRLKAVEAGLSVGDWISKELAVRGVAIEGDRMYILSEADMDDNARKAIETDDLKVDDKGKLSKGLGDIPGRKQETPNLSPREMQAHKDEILRRISKK